MTSFLGHRRVFVTGHTGFKGSWLSLWLLAQGARLRGYALDPPSEPNLFSLCGLARDMDDLRGDVRDLDGLCRAMADFRPEAVVHMAAQALVRPSYDDPVGTFATNAMGTVNVLEAVRRTGGVLAVINVTSDKCYENREQAAGYREGDPMGGHDPYSASKGCAELAAQAYGRSFFSGPDAPGLASVRAGNVIGGGDFGAHRLLPDLALAAQGEKAALIRNPGAVRPWQFVLEPLSGYLALAQGLLRGDGRCRGAWNFGPDENPPRDVAWMADTFLRHLGRGPAWRRDGETGPHETGTLRLDSSKARSTLGWRPRLDTETAVAWTAQWYRAWIDGSQNLRSLALDQIARYQDLLS